jgi:hypothetical protein
MSEFGESFARPIVKELRLRGISTNTRVIVVHQKKTGRWLISGEEGGGAARGISTKGNRVGELGHYVGYVGIAGVPLTSIPIHSFLPNRTFRNVFANDVLRVEAFRYEGSCNITVSSYRLHSALPGLAPKLYLKVLFRGYNGVLNAGATVPTFFDNTGEADEIPSILLPLIQAAVKGVTTVPNHRAHCIALPFLRLPALDITAYKLVVTENEDDSESETITVPTVDVTPINGSVEAPVTTVAGIPDPSPTPLGFTSLSPVALDVMPPDAVTPLPSLEVKKSTTRRASTVAA